MWIVKLGGSLGRDPVLKEWLDTLVALGSGRVVIVPGGGGFAEEVRDQQELWRFDDLAAHNMAVLAMAQMTPGDFVRTNKQVLDLLRQIESVAGSEAASAAGAAYGAVNRSVVAYTGV